MEAIKDPDSDLVVDPTRSAATDEITSREEKAENVPANLAAYIERGLDTKRILHFVKEGKKLRRAAVKFPSEWGIQNLTKTLKDSKYHSQRDEESYKKMQWWNQVEATPSSPKVWHYHPVTALKALRAKASSYLDAEGTLQRGTTGPQVEALQEDLIAFGFDVGPVDGAYGAATEAAVTCLQIETYYHVVDGRLDPQPPFAPDWSSWAIDGKLGPKTKKAMRAWFEEDLTAEYPRDINVAKKPEEDLGFILLDRMNCNGGVFHYEDGTTDRPERDEYEWWGQPPIVYTMERVCRKWAERGNPSIQIGDMTRPQGGTYWRIRPEDEELTYTDEGWTAVDIDDDIIVSHNGNKLTDHGGHDRGRVADVRPMVSNENQVGYGIDLGVAEGEDPANRSMYDRAHSREFLKVLEQESPKNEGSYMIDFVIFGDEKITSDDCVYYRQRNNHGDHYHIRVI